MRPKAILIIISIIILTIALIYLTKTLFMARRVREEARPVRKKPAAELPAISKKFKNPKVAIVMDDFGYNMNNLEDLFDIKKAVTLSILPNLGYSTEIAELARSRGYEVILHLPLESHRKDVREEIDTINSRMKESEVLSKLEEALESVPAARGVSNHMGSKATEEEALMTVILSELKRRRLYFLDSLVTRKTVCRKAANRLGVPYARRDIFLDNLNDEAYIRNQLLSLRRMAFRKGSVVAICHDRAATIKVLAEIIPALSREGVRFVSLSELVG